MLVLLILSQNSLRLSSVLFIHFILFCSSEIISTILSSSSLIHPSASDILLLIPSRVFLLSVIMLFVSICLFSNSSRCLLIYSCIFSIFLKVFDHFYYHYSEFFFRSFAYFLFIYLDVYVSSLFLHLCSISLMFFLFFFFNLLCLRSPFPRLSFKKVEFFLPFDFRPSNIGLDES